MSKASSFAVVLLAVGAHACGLKGPLYLPEPAKEVAASTDEEKEEDKDKKKSDQTAAPPATQQAPQESPR